jgi:uncharacterized membrane protein
VNDVHERYHRMFSRGEGTDRIQFFSDAVFAIAMTLLVLEIRLPESAGDDLGAALVSVVPSFLAYALSFAIIGLNWMTHHRKFRYIGSFDDALVRINLLFLFVVTFVPFPTAVIAEYGDQRIAVILYACAVASLSLLQLWIWVHAHRAGLMSSEVDDDIYRLVRRNLLPVPIVFLASVPFAAVFGAWVTYGWVLLLPVSIVFGRLPLRARRGSPPPAAPAPAAPAPAATRPAPARRSRDSAS